MCGCVLLQAYDQHLNMILGEVEETVTTVEIDDETYEEIIKVSCSALQECNILMSTWCCTVVKVAVLKSWGCARCYAVSTSGFGQVMCDVCPSGGCYAQLNAQQCTDVHTGSCCVAVSSGNLA
jgi:hypothetical protein